MGGRIWSINSHGSSPEQSIPLSTTTLQTDHKNNLLLDILPKSEQIQD